MLTAVRSIWGAIAVITILLFVVAIPIRYNDLRQTDPTGARQRLTPADVQALEGTGLSIDLYAAYYTGMTVLFTTIYISIAIVIFVRRSNDWIAILLSMASVTYGATNFFFLEVLGSQYPILALPSNLVQGFAFEAFPILLLCFPDGRFIPRWMAPFAVVWTIWMVLGGFFHDTPLNLFSLPHGVAFSILTGYMLLCMGCSIYRYRRISTQSQRQQAKWLVFGSVIGIVGFIIPELAVGWFPVLTTPGPVNMIGLMIHDTFFAACALALPISIAFSILRYKLFEVDQLISRGIVYGVVTLFLGGIFFGSTVLLQRILPNLFGSQGGLAIVPAALLIGTLFQPTRRVVQNTIEQRFFKQLPSTEHIPDSAKFGAYVVLEPLGKGGMADLYTGRHLTLNRMAAIKILPPDKADDSDFKARFALEAQTVAALRHPNIVQMFDFGSVKGTYYMAMEYIPGQNLAQYIDEHAPLTLEQTLPIMRDLASALDYAHAQGLVHRDVKPSNVMMEMTTSMSKEPSYRAILTDFGIAKILSDSTSMTKTGTLGTLDYISPEQIISSKEVDHRADIYALGVMLYQMLTGELPFKGDNAGMLVYAHLHQPAPDPRILMPNIPPHVAAAILQALAKTPDDRFGTASEFVKALS